MPLEKGALCPAGITPGSRGCWDNGNFPHGAAGAGAPRCCFIAHGGYVGERSLEKGENSAYWVLLTENGVFK